MCNFVCGFNMILCYKDSYYLYIIKLMDSSRKNLLIKEALSLLELAEKYKTAQKFSRAIKIYCNAMQVLQLIIEYPDNEIASKIKFIDVLVDISKFINNIVLYGKF